MKKLLVVVDMQNDFVSGTLGSPQARAILPNVRKKIDEFEGEVVLTADTHFENYLETEEGKHLPVVHCVRGTDGWNFVDCVRDAMVARPNAKIFVKNTFGSTELGEYVVSGGYESVEFIGVCTDICVISNVLLCKAFAPEIEFFVDASCCAGVTKEKHDAALNVMESCHIQVFNKE